MIHFFKKDFILHKGNQMEITIHSGQRRSCSNIENQCSSPPVHKHILEDQAKNLPNTFVFHWFVQPTSSGGFRLKDKHKKCNICFMPHCLPSQYDVLPSQIIKKNKRREKLIWCTDISHTVIDGISLRKF